MAQLRDIRRRIQSVKNTQQVTRAMKMVAASKLRKSQQAILQARPYSFKLRDIIAAIMQTQELPPHSLLAENTNPRMHLMVIAGDRGLCGSFNTNVFREVEKITSVYTKEMLDLTVLGKKGVEYFRKRGYCIKKSYVGLDKQSLFSLAQELAEYCSQEFIDQRCGRFAITYTEFQSALTQRVVTEWLLPLAFEPDKDSPVNLDYIFYPNSSEILNLLLPRFVRSQIYRSLLESLTSVHGARMTAMDMATRNSQDMISNLTLQYNRVRQAAITKELIEIVSGAEALKGK